MKRGKKWPKEEKQGTMQRAAVGHSRQPLASCRPPNQGLSTAYRRRPPVRVWTILFSYLGLFGVLFYESSGGVFARLSLDFASKTPLGGNKVDRLGLLGLILGFKLVNFKLNKSIKHKFPFSLSLSLLYVILVSSFF